MNLTKQILTIILPMRPAFLQHRSFFKFVSLIFAILCTAGRHTITSFIYFFKQEHQDWSALYRFFSTVKWEPDFCFDEVFKRALKKVCKQKGQAILIAIDDFKVEKVGTTIPHTAYQLDPKSLPFHPNLMWGHRYLHATLIISRKKRGRWQAAKTITVSIELAPHVKKPGKRATKDDWEAYEKEKKEQNLTQLGAALIKKIRDLCDEFGYQDKDLIIVADGSYCNRRIFPVSNNRIQLILRCRKDARLCERSKEKKKFYDSKTFTPHDIYKNEKTATQQGMFYYGRRECKGRFKEHSGVYWQRGARKQELKCIVLFGIRYRKNKNGYTNYREPLYLLTTALKVDVKKIIQWYLYRWEIEVTHRELKNDLGIGQAQVTNEVSVEKCPKLIALANSVIHLAKILLEEEDDRAYLTPPKWYNNRKRISLEYLRRRLRKEIMNNEEIEDIIGTKVNWYSLFKRIAA